MEIFIKSVILSLATGISCEAYFKTVVPKRRWKRKWIENTGILGFAAGFMVIAVTPIPPYILQPVRMVAVVAAVAWVYFRIKFFSSLLLSIIFCCIYWMESVLVASVIFLLPAAQAGRMNSLEDAFVTGLHLCLMLTFHYRYKRSAHMLMRADWERFGIFPVISLVVMTAVCMLPWDKNFFENNVRLTINLGVIVIVLCTFYFIGNLLEKEEEMQRLRLLNERRKNQMDMYYNMQKSFEQQRKHLHDYKNQLNCIQGMLREGRTEETLTYISGLTGRLKKNADYINANHTVVNVVLNQKYQQAEEKGITMTMAVNDLSGITVSEEEMVTLLVNLIDNAIEACEKLDGNRMIQFKMMLEEGQLILSVRNPVKEPVRIKGGRVITSKKDVSSHGIGLLNVEAVIKRNHGTSVLKCEDGWFYFSAMIPVTL